MMEEEIERNRIIDADYSGVCTKCTMVVSADASICPECGYDPANEMKNGVLAIWVIGAVVSVVFPPAALVFLPLGILSWYAYLRKDHMVIQGE